jgi:hypothetical protein
VQIIALPHRGVDVLGAGSAHALYDNWVVVPYQDIANFHGTCWISGQFHGFKKLRFAIVGSATEAGYNLAWTFRILK